MQVLIFILGYFLHFYPRPPPPAQKMKISKNREKYLEISTFYTSAPKIMIICYTVLEIWCMADVIVVFHFGQFLPFYPSNSPKNGNFTKMKKTPEDIFILHNCTKNYDCSLHCYWDREHDGCNCYFSFWASFCPFTPLKPWKMKISKKEKNIWRYHHFTQVHRKWWLYAALFLRYGMWWM